jgi:phosphotransferase system HPr-like phosphotransfer protein
VSRLCGISIDINSKSIYNKLKWQINSNERMNLMKAITVMLNSINDVKQFVNIVSKYDFDIDLTSGRYIVDAKSIMGIFSLDLSKVIDLNIHGEENIDQILEILKPYIVE